MLALCCEAGVGISFVSEQGRFLTRVQGPISGNVLLRRQQYRAADSESLDDSIRKAVVEAWQSRKQEEIEHPFLRERIPLGLVPYAQALLLARHLRGGLDGYPAFLAR